MWAPDVFSEAANPVQLPLGSLGDGDLRPDGFVVLAYLPTHGIVLGLPALTLLGMGLLQAADLPTVPASSLQSGLVIPTRNHCLCDVQDKLPVRTSERAITACVTYKTSCLSGPVSVQSLPV